MSSSRVVQRRRRRVVSCLNSFDLTISKSLKLVSHDISSDKTALNLIELVSRCEKKWIRLLDKVNCKLRFSLSEISRLNTAYNRAQEMLEVESAERRRAERVRDHLRRKIDVIKDILTNNDVDSARRHLDTIDKSLCSNERSFNEAKIDHSAGSLLDPTNFSDMGTSDMEAMDVNRISKYRRAGSAENSVCVTQQLRRSTRLSKFRSSSVPKIMTQSNRRNNSTDEDDDENQKSDDSYVGMKPPCVMRSMFHESVSQLNLESERTNQPTAFGTPSSVHNRLNRPHNFVSRPVLRLELCSFCGRRITFGKSALRCIVCRVIVHPDCRGQLIQTCIPPSVSHTPLSSLSKRTPGSTPKMARVASNNKRAKEGASGSPTLQNGRCAVRNIDLSDLCPEDQHPRIPALVIHSVTEIWARGLNTVGLYRVSGSEKQVRDLFEKFLSSKATPVLARVEDIHVICGCLKLFLRSLSEPLITYKLRPELAAISEDMQLSDVDRVQRTVDLIDLLPVPNRDTLSYLMLHLKTVARSAPCQMGEDNLSRVFGPTLIGYSCPEPQPMQTVTETGTQQAIMRLLFNIPDYVYSSFVSSGPSGQNNDLAESETYFSPVMTSFNDATQLTNTPSVSRKTPRRAPGLSSARKRFFPYLTPHRDTPRHP